MHPEVTELVIRLWRKMRPKRTSGGRVKLDLLEIRAAVFAVRVTLGIWRTRTTAIRRKAVQYRALLKSGGVIDKGLAEGFRQLNISSERFSIMREEAAAARNNELKQYSKRHRRHARSTILSLERHMKRANRLLLGSVSRAEYDALTKAWREHLRWMRLHLVYFKPLQPILRPKRRQQNILDVLSEMAIRGLKNEGYAPPEAREFRRVLRLFVHSSNRGREVSNSLPEMLRYPNNFGNKRFLAQWVISRTNAALERLP
jgi:hypothetical protein